MMELFVETLTGTAFELRVSPFETIMSVKAKIQRLEGIPISQQHLIWQSVELEDDYCLHDYSINDGATLKLVTAMRGGPINTRRIPMEDPALREMAEYMEANRDSLFDKLPGNRQVTLLVFREGDQLNFFRVVDKGDGTLTPLSESLSGASMYNLYDEEDEEEIPTKEKLEENDKMKEKLVSLRNKMDSMTITKKPKKKPRPPSAGRPGSHKSRVRHIPKSSLNKNLCLPPVGHSHSLVKDSIPSHTTETSYNRIIEDPKSDLNLKKELPLTDSASRRSKHDRISPLDSATLKRSLSSVKEDLASNSRPVSGTRKTKESETAKLLSKKDSAASIKRRDSLKSEKDIPRSGSARKKDVTLETLKETLKPPPSTKFERKKDFGYDPIGPTTSSSRKEVTLESLKESFGRPTTSSKYANKERKKEFMIESLSSEEARAMSGLLRQASIERLGSSKIGNFVSGSASKSRLGGYPIGGAGIKEGRVPTPEGRLMSARLQRLSASRDGRIMSPSHRLPPVKTKKKPHKRCFFCAKKTGLATSYQCRCGNNFCVTHRYAEAHNCTFDYKTEGRKIIEQSNPVVSAPKLPKI
ncbi:AN1-type zinc finger protein 4-like [Lineus longissimus]|uniref:AN1-type zinc finger protein 4-like n=1 Tax=Lineus longissimus TaxID=88925 RepID=UPI002B4D455C